MDVLAKRLKWLRNKERYGQKEVAAEIGVTVSGYQKFEYGESDPKLETLVKLADFFKVTTDFLLGRDNTTDEIRELMREILTLESNIENNKQRISIGSLELKRFENELVLSKNKSNTEAYKSAETHLEQVRQRLNQITYESTNMKDKLGMKFIEYIDKLIELPESKPWEDFVINKFSPINVELQLSLFDEYTLSLFSGKLGFIGNYKSYPTIEETEEKQKELYKLLNGKDMQWKSVDVW